MVGSGEGCGSLAILAVWSVPVYVVERGLEGRKVEYKCGSPEKQRGCAQGA